MSGIIHFVSGKVLEITEYEFKAIAPKLKNGGIRLVQTKAGDFIPLNSNTIEYVQHVEEEEPEVVVEIKEVPVEVPVEADEEPVKEEPKSLQERKDEAMKDLMAKSNCKHEPEKLKLYVQHTAKGVRYFPVCSFCGKRERYVSEKKILEGAYAGTPNEKWTAADLESAEPWMES